MFDLKSFNPEAECGSSVTPAECGNLIIFRSEIFVLCVVVCLFFSTKIPGQQVSEFFHVIGCREKKNGLWHFMKVITETVYWKKYNS